MENMKLKAALQVFFLFLGGSWFPQAQLPLIIQSAKKAQASSAQTGATVSLLVATITAPRKDVDYFGTIFPTIDFQVRNLLGPGPGPGHSASTLTVNTRPGGNPAFDKLKVEFGSLTSEGRHRFEEVESGPLHLQPSDEEKGLFGKVTPAQVRLNYDLLAFLGLAQRQCRADERAFVLVRFYFVITHNQIQLTRFCVTADGR